MLENSCIFCELIETKKCFKVFENKTLIAFLDYRPVFPGHTLVVPKKHFETLPEMPATLVSSFFTTLQSLVSAVEKGTNSDGTFVGINNKVSQSVPHFHAHVVPRKFKDGLKGFFWPRTKYSSETEMENIRTSISAFTKKIK